MINISVTVITFNEADNIEACLKSVQWAGEIIVVDHFSSDGTPEIADSLGARVFQEDWQGFAAQKNSAIEKAEGAWILSIDADERVTPPLRREIEDTLASQSAHEGYFIARKNFFCGQWIRHGGWYPDYSLRLFRKESGRFIDRPVHERVEVRGKTGYLKQPLEHYTYLSFADYVLRLERYSSLAAREMSQRGAKSSWHNLLFRPLFTFFKMYALKRGFLDGRAGFFLAISYAYYTFLKYSRIAEEDLCSRR